MRLALIPFLLFALNAYADQLIGRVVNVTDGDTITILDNTNSQRKVRLAGIDAPERKQAFGIKSKQSLSEMVAGRTVSVDWDKYDKYGRIVGKVLLNGSDINLQQVKKGMAWHYKKYEKEQDVEDRSSYAQAEYQAQHDKVGLWSEKTPLAPWNFRTHKNNN